MTDIYEIPDFSGDDFANDKEIQLARAEEKAYKKMIEDSLSVIKQEFTMQYSSHINLKEFIMFKSHTATITQSMKSINTSNKLRVTLAEYTSSFPTARSSNSGTDQYLFGHFTTKNKFPKTYIHKETIKEKLEDFFLKRDVDFESSKEFSRKFQVLTIDKHSLQNLLAFKDLDSLAVFADLEIEFYNYSCLYRSSRKPVSIAEAAVFCELTNLLLNLFE